MSHSTSYSGTSAKPNAKLPSAKASSFRLRLRFARLVVGVVHACERITDSSDEADVERQRDQRQQECCAPDPLAAFRRPHPLNAPRRVAMTAGDGGDSQV